MEVFWVRMLAWPLLCGLLPDNQLSAINTTPAVASAEQLAARGVASRVAALTGVQQPGANGIRELVDKVLVQARALHARRAVEHRRLRVREVPHYLEHERRVHAPDGVVDKVEELHRGAVERALSLRGAAAHLQQMQKLSLCSNTSDKVCIGVL